jgi:acyl carrier protein
MRCFTAAFPAADPEDIRAAKTFSSIPGADSLRLVNLLAVIDEEYGVQIEPTESELLVPFEGIKQILLQHGLN